MGLVIEANSNHVAERVLLPGDPLRAKYIAESFLDDVICYNEIRGMLGFTGVYKGQRVSVQGTGMGIPSISAYTYELIHDYHVKKLIRVGTCGTIQHDISVKDIIIAMSASTDSNFNYPTFSSFHFSPTANFNLLKRAVDISLEHNLSVKVGSVLTTDLLYTGSPDTNKLFAEHGVLAVEMETAALYTMAAKYGVHALSVLTVSDHIFKDEAISLLERQNCVDTMIKLALDTIIES
ncbi:purine-nucleoside phosphorylase [Paenibacillus agilis]|uniref:Purine nucleoside phosphorylase DeoD-type n=1 Tax=Paenibacillus agilis TaxID=3020863 RepID=A0A559IWQ9_9BACL|nr:purine-nucleoside phosphorylase [Paenibacillus agilis]TVX92068.1 purine-nucleoside phosphorylase [Paenibacillus agilis]